MKQATAMRAPSLEAFTEYDGDDVIYTAAWQIVLYAKRPPRELVKGARACHARFLEKHGHTLDWHHSWKMRRPTRFSLKDAGTFSALKGEGGLPRYQVWNGRSQVDCRPPLFATGAYTDHSWLQILLPPRVLEDWNELSWWTTSMAEAFPFRYGTVGPVLCWDPLFPERDNQMSRRLGPILRRHPGFNLGTPQELCDQPLPPVSWMTLLGPELLKTLGGMTKVRRAFSTERNIEVSPIGTGVVIRAGEMPQLGGPGNGADLPLYRKVGSYLKDQRGDQEIELDGLSETQSKAWLARFDA